MTLQQELTAVAPIPKPHLSCGHWRGTPPALSRSRVNEEEPMEMKCTHVGTAKRIRVRLRFSAIRSAWDCRPFGFGRIVAPVASGVIELGPGVDLNLRTGELMAVGGSERRSA